MVRGYVPLEHTMYRDNTLFHVISTGIRGGYYINKPLRRPQSANRLLSKQPVVVNFYNQHKSGVDRATQFLDSLGLYRRDLRWTLRLYRGLIGLSVLNTKVIWELYRGEKASSTRAFVLELAEQLAKTK